MDFERLANRHKDEVYRQMVRVCGNREDAEDALMEALLKAWRSASDLRAPEAFRGWLAQIARRVCWQLKRREALYPMMQLSELEAIGHEPQSNAPSAEEALNATRNRDAFQSVIGSLPAEFAAVYRLREIEQLSGEDTARRLEISMPAMKSRLHRARILVRARINAIFIDGRQA
jgi:RNA polymerase sigma-70 factor (ECF subfamily)